MNFIGANLLLNIADNSSNFNRQTNINRDLSGNIESASSWRTHEKNAFVLYCFLMRHRCLNILYDSRCSSLMEYMSIFDKKLRKTNKKIHSHFRAQTYVNHGVIRIDWSCLELWLYIYYSMPSLSYSISSGALGSPDLLLS